MGGIKRDTDVLLVVKAWTQKEEGQASGVAQPTLTNQHSA